MKTTPEPPLSPSDLNAISDSESLSEYLRSGRAKLADQVRQNPAGLTTARAYSDLVDMVIRQMLVIASRRAGRASVDQCPISVVATGGYGRRELCPHSDIDLTFVPQKDGDPVVERIVKEMFTLVMQVFMDANGMSVGYAYRLIEDCASLDHQTMCGLLDARVIAGSDRIFIQLENEFWSMFNPADFIFTKLLERKKQRDKISMTPRVVEPNLKEGPGGLRDLQTAVWVTQALHSHIAARVRGERAYAVLRQDGGISDCEAQLLADAKEFLFRVRNALHALTGAERDTLVVTRQEEIAEMLGYGSEGVGCGVLGLGNAQPPTANTQHPTPNTQRPAVPPVELFMRDFYSHISTVFRITQDVVRRAENSPMFLGIGLDCIRREVMPANTALSAEDPVWMLWACELAQRYELGFSDDIGREIIDLLGRNPVTQDSVQASEVLTRILASPQDAYPILQQMADLGILGWILPEVGQIMNLIPYDSSHDYTVGQHTLYVTRQLDSLRVSEGPEELSDLRRIMADLTHPEQVYLAALLHDTGKSVEDRPHSVVGEELADAVCLRLGWNSHASDNVKFLVREHLTMAETSRLRDLNLEETIKDFVAIVNDPDRLNMLYLLTYADTSAVGAGVWTQVKGRFLRDLHRRAERALYPEEGDTSGDAGLVLTRRRLMKELEVENLAAEEVSEHIERMPAPYILNTSLNEIALHIGFIRKARQGEPVVDFFDERDSTYTEVTVCTIDDPKPGLLSKIAGVLYAADLDVHSAQVFTRVAPARNRSAAFEDESGGRDVSPTPNPQPSIPEAPPSSERIAIDTLYVDFRGRQLTPGKRKELATNLRAVLTGQAKVADIISKRRKSAEIGGPIEELKVRNDLSQTFSVIEVTSSDERAMLYRTSGALSSLGWDIHSARVSYFKGRSVASFYITGVRSLPESEIRSRLLTLMPISDS